MAHNSVCPLLALFLLFVICNQVTVSGREVPTPNKKQSVWSARKDVDLYVPIVGKVTVPTFGGGSATNNPDSGTSTGGANNGFGAPGNVGGTGDNGGNAFGGTGDNGGNAFGGTGNNGGIGGDNNGFGGTGDNGFGGTGDNGNGDNGFGGTGDNNNGDNGGNVGDVGGYGGRNFLPGGDDTFMPNPGVEIPNPINVVPTVAQP